MLDRQILNLQISAFGFCKSLIYFAAIETVEDLKIRIIAGNGTIRNAPGMIQLHIPTGSKIRQITAII